MDIETEVRDIKQRLIEISGKIDELMYEREIAAMMRLSEDSLREFLEEEPDIYEVEDLRTNLVIHEGEKDIVVAFISSKASPELSETGILITKDRAGFRKAGLKVDSVIKLDKIATVLKDLLVGEPGELDEELRKEVNQKYDAPN